MSESTRSDIEQKVYEALKDYPISEGVVIIIDRDKSIVVRKKN